MEFRAEFTNKMSLLEIRLKKLQTRVKYPTDYINIIYGDAWEVQFCIQDQALVVGIHKTSLSEALRIVLKKLDERK